MVTKDHLFKPIIDQPEVSETCPCKSGKHFGACCGYDYLCDCNSKQIAAECCYLDEYESKEVVPQKRQQNAKRT